MTADLQASVPMQRDSTPRGRHSVESGCTDDHGQRRPLTVIEVENPEQDQDAYFCDVCWQVKGTFERPTWFHAPRSNIAGAVVCDDCVREGVASGQIRLVHDWAEVDQ